MAIVSGPSMCQIYIFIDYFVCSLQLPSEVYYFCLDSTDEESEALKNEVTQGPVGGRNQNLNPHDQVPELTFLITCVVQLEMMALNTVPRSWDCILQAVGSHVRVEA